MVYCCATWHINKHVTLAVCGIRGKSALNSQCACTLQKGEAVAAAEGKKAAAAEAKKAPQIRGNLFYRVTVKVRWNFRVCQFHDTEAQHTSLPSSLTLSVDWAELWTAIHLALAVCMHGNLASVVCLIFPSLHMRNGKHMQPVARRICLFACHMNPLHLVPALEHCHVLFQSGQWLRNASPGHSQHVGPGAVGDQVWGETNTWQVWFGGENGAHLVQDDDWSAV